MKVTILGCGGSGGVPVIGEEWGVCDPQEARNRRLRASILVQTDAANILVDTSPDLRQQLLGVGIDRLDAVLYTHGHADHLHGIDDLRPVNHGQGGGPIPIPIYGSATLIDLIRRRFSYVLATDDGWKGAYKPQLSPQVIDGPLNLGGIEIRPFDQDHGFLTTLGYRFGRRFAYSTDVVAFSDEAFAALEGVEVWLVDCLRYEPHRTHSHLERTLSWIERVRPKRAILTHMNHELDYATLARELPDGVEPAYDGMRLDIGDE